MLLRLLLGSEDSSGRRDFLVPCLRCLVCVELELLVLGRFVLLVWVMVHPKMFLDLVLGLS